VVTVQYEVAERMVAVPGDMNLLAVGIQFYGQPAIVTRLKPGNFYPRPEVDSALVRITPHPDGPPLLPAERSRFFRIARAGFSQPRKKLKNSLSAGLHMRPDEASAWLEQAGIRPDRRAETLSVEEWLALLGTAQAL
jgi:16S rRNA (adenine1518-N6/adenine1519-N6)-dimethyltransferase